MLTKLKFGLVSGGALLLLAACGGPETTTNDSANSTTESSATSSMESSTTSEESSNPKNFEGESFTVTYEQAIASFQETYPESSITSIDFDKDFGEYTFEINGFNDAEEIEWEVSAETGDETKNKTEKKDVDFDDQELMVEELMPIDELITKAEDEASNATLMSWNIEVDDDTKTPVFTAEFEENNNDLEVQLNAETGEFLSTDND